MGSLLTHTRWDTLLIRNDAFKNAPEVNTLDKNIRQVSQGLEIKLADLSRLVATAGDEHQRAAVRRLQDFVKSPASVISAASTTSVDAGVGTREQGGFSKPSWQQSQHFHALGGSPHPSAFAGGAGSPTTHALEGSHGSPTPKAPAPDNDGVEAVESKSRDRSAVNDAANDPDTSASGEHSVSSRDSSFEGLTHSEQLSGRDDDTGTSITLHEAHHRLKKTEMKLTAVCRTTRHCRSSQQKPTNFLSRFRVHLHCPHGLFTLNMEPMSHPRRRLGTRTWSIYRTSEWTRRERLAFPSDKRARH